MGAFSFFSLISKLFSTSPNSDTHILKKRKTSPFMQPNPLHSRSSASSRVHRYPRPESQIPRSVHAPCRPCRFSFSSSSSSSRESRVEGLSGELGVKKDEEVIDVDEMGNSSSLSAQLANLNKLKESAIGSLRYHCNKDEEAIDVERGYVKKDVEVIDVDRVVDRRMDRGYVSGNSIGEEVVEVVCDGGEWQSQEENGKAVVVEHCSDLMNSMEKRIELLSLDRKSDGPVHKKLLEHAERHDPKLKSLSSEIEIKEKKWAALKLLPTAKKPQHEDVLPGMLHEAFMPLTEEEKAEVSVAFSNSSRRKVLTTHEDSNIVITGELLQCLRPGAWLNDEVINLYLELLKEREKREPKKFLKCHFFNTFFYKKLIGGRNGYDFKSVKRWTSQRKLGYCLLDCDKIFVPIHKELHWCLAVINKKDEKFQYLDSLKGIDTQVLQVLARYFVDEVKDKSGKDIDVHSWTQEIVKDLPEQKNGWDCGMFMIKYTDFYSRGLGLDFKQEDMPYFRQRTAKEILRLKAQ